MNFDLDANADEDFFGALKRKNANLDQLFGIEKAQESDHQQSLKYTPIKSQTAGEATNTNNDVASHPTETWQTLMAKVASAFKKGESVGKVGVALLRNNENTHKIIIYKTKVLVLATCTLHAETAQVHRQKRYLQFYDDTACYWSIYFDMEAHEQEFWNKLRELDVAIDDETSSALETNNTKNVSEEAVLTLKHESKQMAKSDAEKRNDELNRPPKDTHSKTELITRMAKMGQQLPKLSQAAQSSVDCTDSSDTEVITTPLAAQQKPALLPRTNSKVLVKSQMVPICNANMTAVLNPTTTMTMPAATNIETQFMQMLLTENRTQNTELRMNMGKLESKMEKVLDKIDVMRTNVNEKSNKDDEILALEEKLLEVKKENRKLKLDMEALQAHSADKNYESIRQRHRQELVELELFNVENLERLVGDLLRKHANILEKYDKLERELAVKNEKLKTHEIQLHDEQTKCVQATDKLQQLELQIKALHEKLVDKEKQEAELRRKHAEDTVTEMQYLEEKIKSLQECLDVKEKSEKVLRQQLAENIENQLQVKEQQDRQIEMIVKEIMNNLYSNLAIKLENMQPLQSNVAIAVVGKTIREATLKAMERMKQ